MRQVFFSRITQLVLAFVVMPACLWMARKLNVTLDTTEITTDATFLIGAGLAAAWSWFIHFQEHGCFFVHPSEKDAPGCGGSSSSWRPRGGAWRSRVALVLACVLVGCPGCFKPDPSVPNATLLMQQGHTSSEQKLSVLVTAALTAWQQAEYARIDAAVALDVTTAQSNALAADAVVNAQAQALASTNPAGAVTMIANNATLRQTQALDFQNRLSASKAAKRAAVDAQFSKFEALIPLALQDSSTATQLYNAVQAYNSAGLDSATLTASLNQILSNAQQLLPKVPAAASTAKATVIPAP